MTIDERNLVKSYSSEFNIFFLLSQYLWRKKKKNYFWLFFYKSYAFFIIIFYIIICLFDILYLIVLCICFYMMICNLGFIPNIMNIIIPDNKPNFFYIFLLIFILIYFMYFLIVELTDDILIVNDMLFNYDNHIYDIIKKHYKSSSSFNFVDTFLRKFLLLSYSSDVYNPHISINDKYNELFMLYIYFGKINLNLYKNKPFWIYFIIYLYLIVQWFLFYIYKFPFIFFYDIFSTLFWVVLFFSQRVLVFFIYKYIIVDLKIEIDLYSIFIRHILQMSDQQLFEIFKKSFEFYNSKYTFEEFLNLDFVTYTSSIYLNLEIHKRLMKYKKNL